MGGGGSKTVHVYTTPPAVQKKLDEQAKAIKTLKEEARKRGDPKHFQKNAKDLLNKFVASVSKLELTSFIEKQGPEKHVGILGPISCGKTTMVNAMFGLNLPVSMGHCTEGCSVVHSTKDLVVWDVGGTNDDYEFYKPESLSFVKDLDMVVIIFDNDIRMVANMLRVVYILNKNILLIRSKCDQYSDVCERTLEEEQRRDTDLANAIIKDQEGYAPVRTYCMSSKMQSHDWETIKKMITAPKTT